MEKLDFLKIDGKPYFDKMPDSIGLYDREYGFVNGISANGFNGDTLAEIIFLNTKKCNQILYLHGDFKEEGYKHAFVFREDLSKDEIELINDFIMNNLPAMWVVRFFQVPDNVFKSISDQKFINHHYQTATRE